MMVRLGIISMDFRVGENDWERISRVENRREPAMGVLPLIRGARKGPRDRFLGLFRGCTGVHARCK